MTLTFFHTSFPLRSSLYVQASQVWHRMFFIRTFQIQPHKVHNPSDTILKEWSVIMLSVIMLSVIMLSVIMLSVIIHSSCVLLAREY